MSMSDYEDGLKQAYEQPGAIADYEAGLPGSHSPSPDIPDVKHLYVSHKDQQQRLADVNERVATAKELLTQRLAEIEAEWRRDNAELLQEQDETEQVADIVESDLRIAIIEAYKANPTSKTIATGLSVRVTKKPVYDKDQAFGWALKHQLAIKLDEKQFEKLAEAGAIDTANIVTFTETISAVIGK